MPPIAGETLHDIEACRAANEARYYGDLGHDSRRHPRHGRMPSASRSYVCRNGLTVTAGRTKHRYAEATGHRAKYAHIPRFIFIVWRRQQVALMDVRFLCGGNSTHALLTDEPTLPVCAKCTLVDIGADEAVRRLS